MTLQTFLLLKNQLKREIRINILEAQHKCLVSDSIVTYPFHNCIIVYTNHEWLFLDIDSTSTTLFIFVVGQDNIKHIYTNYIYTLPL